MLFRRLASLVFPALLLLGGCEPATPAGTSASKAASGGAAELRLGYFANLTHAQAVLGVDSGEFAEAIRPAALSTRVFNAGPSVIEALFAGEIDIGYVGPSPALNAHFKSRGAGIRIIAGASANGVSIVARHGSGIEKLEDLKSKRIATPQLGNTQDVSARHYLVNRLGQADADNVLPVPNSEQLAMMERGHIDAAWVPEPWGARLVAEAGGVLLAEERSLWPGGEFTLALIVVSPEFLKTHPDIIKKVLAAHILWTKRLNEQPHESRAKLAAALNKLTGKALPQAVFEAAFGRTKFTDRPLEESLKTFADWAYDLGFAKGANLTGLVDTSILDSLGSRP